jgi:hypothetical protein
MSLSAGLLLLAQSAAPIVATPAAASHSVAESVSASVRIMRPTVIRAAGTQIEGVDRETLPPQRKRDEAGTMWVEFS